MLDIKRVIASKPKNPVQTELKPLYTVWGEAIANDATKRKTEGQPYPSPHPHPQFERDSFYSLNGWWSYCFEPLCAPSATWQKALDEALPPSTYEGEIHVPFSPESPLSGVGRQLRPDELLWYSTKLPALPLAPGEHLILHFDAVDYACACFINNTKVGTHVGGYLPFKFDITDFLSTSENAHPENTLPQTTPAENTLCLCVYDPSDTGVQLRGKQKLARGGIWYTAQSGIWQAAWLEVVPHAHIESLEIDANPKTGTLHLGVTISKAALPASPALTVCASDGEQAIATATVKPSAPTQHITLAIENPHLWSPDDPYLYSLELTYGEDTVKSYCAFRSVSVAPDAKGHLQVCLNDEPIFLRGVLDQGYWPDGLLSAPCDEALIFDIQTAKSLGFNMMRKHLKVEPDRWYYHCDRLGMLVWQDMITGGAPLNAWQTSYKPTLFRAAWTSYADNTPAHQRKLSSNNEHYQQEWKTTCTGIIGYLKNHPSIITWVLFNEAWGQFCAAEATAAVRKLDPSRLIDAVSGWYDQQCGDFFSVHNYFRPLEVYRDPASHQRAFVISEFGGVSYNVEGHASLETLYGYDTFTTASEFKTAAKRTLAQADALKEKGLAGFVYTQLTDVEEETNGILTYDRRVNKFAD